MPTNLRLRVDDFPFTKSEEAWKHNLENFKKFDAVLERNKIESYTLGVIPKYATSEQLDWLAENPRVEVALHGIEHDERFPNEFREFETEDDICKKLMSAKEPLRGCNGENDVTTYIPPHNVVDLRTARALVKAGFRTLMCGPGTTTEMYGLLKQSKLFGHHNLTYSGHPYFYGRSDEMLACGAVKMINDSLETTANNVVTLHWTWEWNIGLDHLDRFLSQINL